MFTTIQVAVTSTPSVAAMIPPGAGAFTLTNAGAVTIYVGLSASVTTATGFPVPTGGTAVSVTTFKGSGGGALYAVIAGTPPLLAASSAVPGIAVPGAMVPASPGASGGDTAYLGITISR